MSDPFDTAALRGTVLAAWHASDSRFREDANTEEDHARGYYRDRVITELAQNAADAATLSGVVGRLAFVLRREDDGAVWLRAHNTGSPLSVAGVRGLATMRASAKHDSNAQNGPATVGRFGVGFAAVRAVSDHISISSGGRGVLFDLERARELLAVSALEGAPNFVEQVSARGVDLPILRLPFAYDDGVDVGGGPHGAAHDSAGAEGFATTVALRMRDDASEAVVRAQLDQLDDILLLTLPGLGEVTIDRDGAPARSIASDPSQWHAVHATGVIPAQMLADRPVEERQRPQWSLTWVLARQRVDGSGAWRGGSGQGPDDGRSTGSHYGAGGAPTAQVVHAPTPTDEPCTLPATLIATFPLDPSRRHVAPGPVTDLLVAEAAKAYVDLAGQVARSGGEALRLVPTGLAAGAFDAALHERVRAGLRTIPIIRALGGREHARADLDGGTRPAVRRGEHPEIRLLRADEAHLLAAPLGSECEVVAELARTVTDLTWLPADQRGAARLLGVATASLSDVVESLPVASMRLLDLLELHAGVPGVVEALADLPVRLSDGRTVRGPRAIVLAHPDEAPPIQAHPDDADYGNLTDEARPPDLDEQADQAERSDPPGVPAHRYAGLDAFSRWGLRVSAPDQFHPFLLRLGAVESDPATILGLVPVTQAISDLSEFVDTTSLRADLDPADVAALEAVLVLVSEVLRAGGEVPGSTRALLEGLPLVSADGSLEAARDLTMPGSAAPDIFDALIPVALEEIERWGEQALAAVGVRTGVSVWVATDVVADEAGASLDSAVDADPAEPDRWAGYLAYLAEHLGEGAYVGEVVAVADLDAVADDRWGAFLGLLTASPEARAALVAPVRGAASYTAWWLRSHFGAPFARPGVSSPFLAPVPRELAEAGGLDDVVWLALGAIGSLAEVSPLEWDGIFEMFDDVGARYDLADARELWGAWSAAAVTPRGPLPPSPDRIVALTGAHAQVCDARDVVVSAEPMWRQAGCGDGLPSSDVLGIVPAHDGQTAERVAEFLDVPVLCAAQTPVSMTDSGTPASSPLGVWTRHDGPFSVESQGRGGPPGAFEAHWWVSADGELHATGLEGLAHAYAQREGRWAQRATLAMVLRDPKAAAERAADDSWE